MTSAHRTTRQVEAVIAMIGDGIGRRQIDAKTAARLLALNIAIQREHDGKIVIIDHDPPGGLRLQLRRKTGGDNGVELTLEPERTGPRTTPETTDAATSTREALIGLMDSIGQEQTWSEINPELHTVEDLVETHRNVVTAKNLLTRWLDRAGDAARGESPCGQAVLAELVGGLQDTAETSFRAGWKNNTDRGHPARIELTIYGTRRRAVALTRYQPAHQSGADKAVWAIGSETRGFARVELNEIAQNNEHLERCPTMEIIDAYDAETRKRSSSWADKLGWDRLLRTVALSWAWREAAGTTAGNDLCELRRWHTW